MTQTPAPANGRQTGTDSFTPPIRVCEAKVICRSPRQDAQDLRPAPLYQHQQDVLRAGGEPALAACPPGGPKELRLAGDGLRGEGGAQAPRAAPPPLPLSAPAQAAGLERSPWRSPLQQHRPQSPGEPRPAGDPAPAWAPRRGLDGSLRGGPDAAPEPAVEACALGDRALDGAAGPRGHGAAALRGGGAPSSSDESAYLRRNVEHLRFSKRQLESQVVTLEDRVQFLEQQNQQYKALYEQAKSFAMCRDSGEMELSNLQQQLGAVQLLKDALNTENMELQNKLRAAQSAERTEVKHTGCVICMDNLANVVCLPCKHLSLCSFCCQQNTVTTCPICRTKIEDEMQIFIP